MKRALPWILICLAALGGLYVLGKRNRKPAPVQGPAEASLFTAAPAGSGTLLQLHPAADQPLRSVRFLPALGNGDVLAQVLTQTGDQFIGRFHDGQFEGTLRLPLPEGAPAAFFRFARLEDAAALEDGSLLLLYGDGTGGTAAWLVNVDAASQTARWALKAAGSRMALEPGGRSCLLWDGKSLARASWAKKPALDPIALPDGVSILDAALALPGGILLLAHPGGLALQKDGAWTLTPLPEPGGLSFPGAPGALAAAGQEAYWQPRPGQLARVGADGAVSAVDLSKLTTPSGRERDTALLRLAGADARGRLWFALATPDLTIAPHAAAPDQPSAALQATAALSGGAPLATPAAFDPAPWTDYLKGGLDRAYAWSPADASLHLVDWKARWPALGAPADFTLPLPRQIQPEGGALLLDLDTRAWWLSLEKLAP